MAALKGRPAREHRTLISMLQIWCDAHHSAGSGELCLACGELPSYAHRRLLKCPFGQHGPVCERCPIDRYKTPAPRPATRRNALVRAPHAHPACGRRDQALLKPTQESEASDGTQKEPLEQIKLILLQAYTSCINQGRLSCAMIHRFSVHVWAIRIGVVTFAE